MTIEKKAYVRPLDIRHGHIDMSHGAGGKASAQLIRELFLAAFDNAWLRAGDDAAVLPSHTGKLVMATDAHIVSPLFFPGGDIGSLAINGTVNDLAMLGAQAQYLSASFILEEGFPLTQLKTIAESMAEAARVANVAIVTGDTKVVERGKGDGVFISTTGVGFIDESVQIGGAQAKVGDVVIISGTMGDHGIAIMSKRAELAFETEIVSDCAGLNHLVKKVLTQTGIHVLRDPTRGGLATSLNEIAQQSGVGIMLDEAAIPVKAQVDAACEFLGLDPLYVANEGKMIVICAAESAQATLEILRADALGKDAAIIGTVIADPFHFVQMQTRFGGKRVVDWLSGEQLPRIC